MKPSRKETESGGARKFQEFAILSSFSWAKRGKDRKQIFIHGHPNVAGPFCSHSRLTYIYPGCGVWSIHMNAPHVRGNVHVRSRNDWSTLTPHGFIDLFQHQRSPRLPLYLSCEACCFCHSGPRHIPLPADTPCKFSSNKCTPQAVAGCP